jgi:hypothetical protein
VYKGASVPTHTMVKKGIGIRAVAGEDEPVLKLQCVLQVLEALLVCRSSLDLAHYASQICLGARPLVRPVHCTRNSGSAVFSSSILMYVFRALSTSFASMLQTGCARPGWNEVQAGLVARLLPASLAPLHAHPAGLVAV